MQICFQYSKKGYIFFLKSSCHFNSFCLGKCNGKNCWTTSVSDFFHFPNEIFLIKSKFRTDLYWKTKTKKNSLNFSFYPLGMQWINCNCLKKIFWQWNFNRNTNDCRHNANFSTHPNMLVFFFVDIFNP